MNGAVYALIVNVCIAVLFAAAFAVVRASWPQQRATGWFCATYLCGMFAPLSELGIHFSDQATLFMASSYLALVASASCFAQGVAVLARLMLPRFLLPGIAALALAGRVSLDEAARNALYYGMIYQFPFYATLLVSTAVAIGTARRGRDPMWIMLGIIFAIAAAYFALKPFFAAAFGSGPSARAYAASSYALFSQALGGVLTVMAGLAVLLMVVRSVLHSSVEESETDMLTKVANRRGFERRAARMLTDARAAGAPLAAIMLDLDHFKRINDRYGHATGDAVLHAVAQAMAAVVPASALVARLGGEEFVALLDRTTLRGAALTAEAIRAAVSDLGAHLPAVTISGGIAELRPSDTLVTLLDRADRRAYEAKQNGRDRIYPPVSRAI